METKPYDLQSPEQIAKDYGGNKQKIAEAMQMGIIDPTAGTMAGMFIDRMRSAAQMEAAPQQSVAQQVFAPPAPPQPPMGAPAGLGATPEAAAMPPMGAPPPQGMPPQGMGPPPQGEMPMMAEGGMVPPYASGGGLSELPVPDTMFDEPTNGGFDDGYAGGGLVAFAAGARVDEDEDEDGQGYAAGAVAQPSAPRMSAVKDPMDAFKPEYLKTLQSSISGLMPQSNKYADLMMEDVERRRNPETMGKDIKRARNDAMTNFGFALMASKNPSFLGAFGEAGIPAAAALKADIKDLKKDARDALVEGAQAEGLKNTAARDLANLTLQNANITAQLQSGNLDREQRVQLEKLQRENALKIAMINENGANYRARLQESGANTRANIQAGATLGAETRQTARIYRDQAEAARDRAMTLNREFAKETNKKTKAALADQVLAELRNYANYNNQLKGMGGVGVNWEKSAFRTLNDWAKDKANNYTIPYTKNNNNEILNFDAKGNLLK